MQWTLITLTESCSYFSDSQICLWGYRVGRTEHFSRGHQSSGWERFQKWSWNLWFSPKFWLFHRGSQVCCRVFGPQVPPEVSRAWLQNTGCFQSWSKQLSLDQRAFSRGPNTPSQQLSEASASFRRSLHGNPWKKWAQCSAQSYGNYCSTDLVQVQVGSHRSRQEICSNANIHPDQILEPED